MTVTIGTIDHVCTQREEQGCGEIIERGDGWCRIRKYIIQGDGRIPALFLTRAKAEASARAQGYTIHG